jgi:chaperonin cofactor prefoldin
LYGFPDHYEHDCQKDDQFFGDRRIIGHHQKKKPMNNFFISLAMIDWTALGVIVTGIGVIFAMVLPIVKFSNKGVSLETKVDMMTHRFDTIDANFKELDSKFSQRMDKTDANIKELDVKLNQRMDKLEGSIEKLDSKLSQRLDMVEIKLTELDRSQVKLENKVSVLSHKVRVSWSRQNRRNR